ncbi:MULTISPECIES: transcriptional regulator [Aminobacter]|uniref:RNA polymerase sigma-70 factor (ECF subfamily) n=1 Tax=Aminobacter aminovorans TaxID=83263 RepID=A0AAC8YMQ0_AMIAI|nr:transcriptional regulator [Aminobacter aminovorans]MRX35248.1 transcriptional regulator [Aminobacter sp. MDW-2]QOF69609.1 transcriptional regulator [Aminobacter sp. SR38]AMS40251.1 transcriptional regulator [Aminobacter aminovorans]MBB3710284.1 RNA polymerase sigma-70 factor (ECF subfamily) [Aminobacter aminovorans]QNH35721.1 transcriptional regulator [Aminobacter sp. MDW-2]
MLPRPYAELLRKARRATRRADEAEDLLQTVLVAAVEAGRTDLSNVENRRWLEGALRRRAAFDARSAVRRRKREQPFAAISCEPKPQEALPVRFVATLPPGLRTTTLLALTGHTRQEIAWLQHLADPALRQRIAEIRRRWLAYGGGSFGEIPGLTGTLAFGSIRRSLLALARQPGALLASHDPDGHLFVVGTSQNPAARQLNRRATDLTE